MKLRLVPCTRDECVAFVRAQHRHAAPSKRYRVAIAAELDGRIVGVAELGEPKARGLDRKAVIEVTRLATDGTLGACSFLLTRAKRLGQAMGYRRVATYNLLTESGASLLAALFHEVAIVRGRPWSCKSRPRGDAGMNRPHRRRWEDVLAEVSALAPERAA